MSMKPAVRLARMDELSAIQELNQELCMTYKETDPHLSCDWPYADGKEHFRMMINGEAGVCYVAEIDENIVGYLVGSMKEIPSYRPVPVAEVENIFVKPDYRSSGVGKELITAFRAWCMEHGAKRMMVSAYADNDRSINFYKSAGFLPYSLQLEMDVK